MKNQTLLSLPLQKYRGTPRLYRGFVLVVLALFVIFRAQRLWFNLTNGFLDLFYLLIFFSIGVLLATRRSWLSLASLSILSSGVACLSYLGSPLFYLWVTAMLGGFLLAGIELTREWSLLRWLSTVLQNKSLSLWPIEGAEGDNVPNLFSWQTEINTGVLYQRIHHGDDYRGGAQRIPVAKAPLDLNYIGRVLQQRTAFFAGLLLVPLFVFLQWHYVSNFWVAPNPTDVAMTDIDGDNDLDIITSNLGFTSASILRNDGNGRFAWYIGVSGAADAIKVGAIRHKNIDLEVTDPYPDLVLQAIDNGKRSITNTVLDIADLSQLIDPMGYSLQAIPTTPPVAWDEVFASYDFDDCALTTKEFPFQTEILPSEEVQSWQAFVDLDRDGTQDAVAITSEGVQVFFSLSTNEKNKLSKKNHATLQHPVRSDYRVNNLAVADLDHDGLSEIIVSAPELEQILSYEVDGQEISDPKLLLALPALSSFALGDVDGDGWQDLVTIKGITQSIDVYLNHNGAFQTYSTAGENFQHIRATAPRLALGDLDGDGDLDLATTDFVRDRVRVFFNDGAGIFSQR